MYETFYRFHGKPFQLTPDPRLLFQSKTHKRAMSYLRYGLEQGEGFVMITGAVGTGKTLLIQMLFEQLSNRHVQSASLASANLNENEILPAVAAAFELEYEGRSKEALLQDIREYLLVVNARNSRSHALLVVDEAQTLTAAALEMLRILANLQYQGRALLQVFLVGQTELRRIIVNNHMEQLRQRIVASYRLEPLGREECEAYIRHRLNQVGWRDDPALSSGVFEGVHRASRGIPRRVNLIMDRLLLYGYLEEQHHLDHTSLVTVLAEMRNEMAGVPATLESSSVSDNLDLMRATAVTDREAEFAAMEVKLNDLLRLMREKIRLKETMQDEDTAWPREADAPPAGRTQLHGRHGEK